MNSKDSRTLGAPATRSEGETNGAHANRGVPWRLLVTWDAAPGWNMALDEALLASADPRPVLRFYTWQPHALSLGYFQRRDSLAPGAKNAVIVRRFSGGGAIHHADELTFSVAAPGAHALFRGEVRESYERVHGVLARAFAALGVRAELCGTRALALDSDRAHSGMCFHRSTALDLVWDGRKGVGSAQRRSGGRVLHHGSIKLGRTDLEEGVAYLHARAPGLSAAELALRIQAAFTPEWAPGFEAAEPTRAELEHAARRASFYTSEEFVRRR